MVEITTPFDRNYGAVLCKTHHSIHLESTTQKLRIKFRHLLGTSSLCHKGHTVSVLRSDKSVDPGWLPITEAHYVAVEAGLLAPIVWNGVTILLLMRSVEFGHLRLCKATDLFRLNPGWRPTLNPPEWAPDQEEWRKRWTACVLSATENAPP